MDNSFPGAIERIFSIKNIFNLYDNIRFNIIVRYVAYYFNKFFVKRSSNIIYNLTIKF